MTPVFIAFLSACGNTANSLTSSGASKSGIYNTETTVAISIIPSFVICLVLSYAYIDSITVSLALMLTLKNIFYGFGFYLRYFGLQKLGAFNGSFLAATQPIIISCLSIFILGEDLDYFQWTAIIIMTMAMLLPTGVGSYNFGTVAKLILAPAIFFSISTIADRYILVHHMTPENYFIWDKITVFPAVMIALMISGKFKTISFKSDFESTPIKIIVIILLGATWGAASYTYAVSLAGEKTAIITLVRNMAFPMAAVAGGLLFKEIITTRQYASLALVVLSIFVGIMLKNII